jgi:hypothetical protein
MKGCVDAELELCRQSGFFVVTAGPGKADLVDDELLNGESQQNVTSGCQRSVYTALVQHLQRR